MKYKKRREELRKAQEIEMKFFSDELRKGSRTLPGSFKKPGRMTRMKRRR
jgi:hypothetical protein